MNYPIKISLKTEWRAWFLILLSVLSGVYFYAHFPTIIVSHWNYIGQPDGYIGKFWGAFFSTMFLVCLYLLFMLIPIIDPQKDKYRLFQKPFLAIRDIVSLFIFLIFLEVSLYNLGYMVDVSFYTPILVGALLILIGKYIRTVQKNWFVGVRTPWTLSSDTVWAKTNSLAGVIFSIIGALTIILTLFIKKDAIWFMIIAIVAAAIYLTVYSYMEFQKEQDKLK